MYEYGEGQTNYTGQQAQIVTKEQLKAIKKAENKVNRKKFWKKIGTGLCVGLVFGITAGCGYEVVTRTVDYFFPNEKQVANVQEKSVENNSESKSVVAPKESDDSEEIVKTIKNKDERPDKPVINGKGMDVSDIVTNTMPSIVSITNKSVQEVRSMFGMGIQQYESTSVGSGIIINIDGEELLIVTNDHVVADANSLTVGFIDDEVYPAIVKGTDPDLDLAVISVKISDVKESTLKEITPAIIGDSDKIEVGEQVVAIGNALGYGQSVTTGIVSALDRDITDDRVDNPLIQTDAAINPGNSGGALYNMEGELIGINCAKIASTSIEGVGYAIPISSAMPIVESLMNRVARELVDEKNAGYIGITGVAVDESTSVMYGIPEGIYLQTIEEDSPAQKAGLVKSDVVKKFDGVSVKSIADIREKLNYYEAGETVEMEIYHLEEGEYVQKTVSITLGSRKGTSLDTQEDNGDSRENDPDENDNSGQEPDDGYGFEDFGNGFFRNDDGSFGFRFGY